MAAVLFGWTVTQLHTHPGLVWDSEVAGEPFSLKSCLSPLVLEFHSRFPVAPTALLLVVCSLCFRLITWLNIQEM